MKYIYTLTILLIGASAWSQVQQGKLLSQWSDNSLPSSSAHDNRYNEVWGIAQDGREYAIIGTTWGTHFIDVTDPNNIIEVDRIKGATVGASVVHRDYHDYNGYLYAVCDEGSASTMQIIDMSTLPDSVSVVYDSFELIRRAHNIFIDEVNALLYGAISYGPLIVIDISEPTNPKKVATYTNIEGFNLPTGSHDLIVRNGLALINIGYDGLMVADFSTPDSAKIITTLSTSEYPQAGYNHSGWLSEDGNFYYMADENHGYAMKIINLTQAPDLKVEGVFDAESSSPVSIPHNQVVAGNYLYVSYYFDGLQVYDITSPENPVRIMHYPTSSRTHQNSRYQGAWGVYPFLPSGNVLVSDMQEGLFVIEAVDKLSSTKDKFMDHRKINVLPNPISKYFTIDAQDLDIMKVSLIDITGEIVQTWDPSENYAISEQITSGQYIVSISSKSATKNVSIVVKN